MSHYPTLATTLPPTYPYRPDSPALVFADTETGGRRGGLRLPFLPNGRRIWDIALCRRNPDGHNEWLEAFVRLEDLPFDPDDAEQMRLLDAYGRFSERHPQMNPDAPGVVLWEEELAEQVMTMFRPTPGMDGLAAKPTLVGAVPSFEDLGIGDLLRRHNLIDSEPPWHFHLLDIEVLAAGRVGWAPPIEAKKLTRRLGIDPDRFDAHTARGDVDWAMAVFDRAYAPLWRIWAGRLALTSRRLQPLWSGRQRPAQARRAA